MKLNWIGEKALLEIADNHQSEQDGGITTSQIKDRAGLRTVDNISGRLNNQFENMQEMGREGLVTAEQLSMDEYEGAGIPPNRWSLTEEGERVLFEDGVYERLKAQHTNKGYDDVAIDDEVSMLTADLKALEHRLDRFDDLLSEGEYPAEPPDEVEIVAIEDRLAQLDGEIGGLKSRMSTLAEKIENPADYYDSQPPGYIEIQRDLEALQNEIEQLQSTVRTLEDSVAELTTDMNYIMNRDEQGNGILSYDELVELVLMLEEVIAAQNIGLEHAQSTANNNQLSRLDKYFESRD